jgi:hypothetical protein
LFTILADDALATAGRVMSSTDTAADRGLPPPIQDFLPSTFLERGIAVPFTTPMLAGTRTRPGGRVAMELIVPNPSGGRGVYILPWEDLSAICRPSIHDARLTAAVATVQGVTPMTIRKAARETASLGFAGRSAAAAAREADATDHQSALAMNFELLLALVRRAEGTNIGAIPPEQERPIELERRARRAIARIAPELGRTPESIATALEELAALFSGVGLGGKSRSGRIPTLLARMMRLRGELQGLLEAGPGDMAQEADLVAGAIDLTTNCARVVLADAQGIAADVVDLLRRWIIEPEPLAQLLARPDWLLDGWDRIVALWETAPSFLGKEATLTEMCNLVPTVPREIGNWVSHQLTIDADMQRHRRKVVLLEDWRTGRSVVDLMTRNEALLEQAA